MLVYMNGGNTLYGKSFVETESERRIQMTFGNVSSTNLTRVAGIERSIRDDPMLLN